MKKIYEIFGGRKMFFAIVLLIIASVFVFVDKSDFSQWSDFTKWVFGIFALGNGVEYIGKRFNKEDKE